MVENGAGVLCGGNELLSYSLMRTPVLGSPLIGSRQRLCDSPFYCLVFAHLVLALNLDTVGLKDTGGGV